MGEAARIYAEQLHRFRYGHALWWPEHTRDLDGHKREVEIGDVGYVDEDGAFHPLFNVVRPANHERKEGYTLPPDFVPFDSATCSIEPKENFILPGPVHSSSIKSRRIRGELAAYVIP